MNRLILVLALALCACDKPADTPSETTAETTAETTTQAQEEAETTAEETAEPAKKATYEKVEFEAIKTLAQSIENSPVIASVDGVGDSYESMQMKGLRHDAFRGPIGPFDTATVALDSNNDNVLTAWIFAETDDGRVAYRAGHQIGYINEVAAVFFDDLDKDGDQDVFVMTTWMSGMGAEGAVDRHQTIAFEWDQKADRFVANGELFEGEAPSTAAEVRADLRKRGRI